MALVGSTNAQRIWNFCIAKGLTPYGVAGLMGNIDAESALISINLQDSCQGRLKCNDETYVALVDSGVYTKEQFVYDHAGFGLCQWTYWTRKKALYEYAKSTGRSIGDLEMQLEYLFIELQKSFSKVLNVLKTATSVMEASDIVLMEFECPHNAESHKIKRASFGQKYYTLFATNSTKGVENMGYLYFTKGQSVKVSEHFVSTEFDCHGRGCCSQTVVNEKIIEYLEKIRTHFNAPITITSPYRCPTHNSRIGGATGSRHSKGDAADIVVKGVAPREVAKYAESIGIMGIGLYETSSDGHFVHIDTREKKSFWYGQKEAYRSTFGGSAPANTTTGTTTTTNTTSTTYKTLSQGSSGEAVKTLQENLNTLGHSCGTADGIYGAKTANAVREFQKKHNLTRDGIAGPLTQAAIKSALAGSFNAGDTVIVVANLLNVRKGAGTNYAVKTTVKKNAVYTLSEVQNGWGKLQEISGWVSLQYCQKQ